MIWRLITRYRRALTVAAVPLAAVLSLAAETRRPAGSGRLDAAAALVAAPLQAGVTGALGGLSALGETLFGGARLRRENAELRRELVRLRQEVETGRERIAEAARLERMLQLRERVAPAVLAAGVIGRDASGLYRTVIIDRGAADGLRRQQAVLAAEGVVGRVVKVFPRSALVLLLTDRSSGVDALVQRTRDQGVVQGRGAELCELRYLAREAQIEVGDALVTSGMDGVFPKGIRVGQVSRVEKGGYLFQGVEVRPAAALDRLEEVWVVLAAPGEER